MRRARRPHGLDLQAARHRHVREHLHHRAVLAARRGKNIEVRQHRRAFDGDVEPPLAGRRVGQFREVQPHVVLPVRNGQAVRHRAAVAPRLVDRRRHVARVRDRRGTARRPAAHHGPVRVRAPVGDRAAAAVDAHGEHRIVDHLEGVRGRVAVDIDGFRGDQIGAQRQFHAGPTPVGGASGNQVPGESIVPDQDLRQAALVGSRAGNGQAVGDGEIGGGGRRPGDLDGRRHAANHFELRRGGVAGGIIGNGRNQVGAFGQDVVGQAPGGRAGGIGFAGRAAVADAHAAQPHAVGTGAGQVHPVGVHRQGRICRRPRDLDGGRRMIENEMGPDARAGIAHQDAGPGHPGRDAAGFVFQRRPDQVAQADVVVIEQFVDDGRGRFLRIVEGGRGGRGPDAHRPARRRVHEALAEAAGIGLRPGEIVQHAGAGQQQRSPHGVGQGGHVGPDVAVLEEIRRADPDIVGMADIQRQGGADIHRLHEQPAHGIGRGRR